MEKKRKPWLALAAALAAGLVAAGCTQDQPAPQGAAAAAAGQTAVSPAGIATVRLPAGTFTMGSPDDQIGRWGNEGPQRQVTISSDFWMGVYPVTQAEWTLVMGDNPSHFLSDPAAGEAQGRRPVETVSWYDAIVFANRLSIMEGLSPAYRIAGSTNPDDWGAVPETNFWGDAPDWEVLAIWDAVEIVPGSDGWRLPTEAQWEYAARAGTTTAFSDGTQDWEDQAALDGTGWFAFNSGGMTREVGRLQANWWGLHDMHGNVGEWVWDWVDAYPAQAQTDPAGGEFSELGRVSRGGSWFHSARSARSANRSAGYPFDRPIHKGLRLVRP